MKNIIYLFALLCSWNLVAQNWTPFPYNQKSWFEFENPFHYSKSVYYADSLEENGDTTNHYFLLNYLDDLVNVEENCLEYNYYGTTWLDFLEDQTTHFVSFKIPFQEVNGLWYLKGSLVFDQTLEIGESITVFPTNFDEVKITCTNKTTESIFGITDSIKVFSLKAYNNGQPVDSGYDNHEYKLSKNYGFISFLPFSKLLGNPNTTAKLVGFEDNNQVIQGTKAWTIADFIPYEAGDVIYYKDSYYDYLNDYYDFTYGIDSITSNATIEADTVKYTYYKLSETGEIISDELTKRTIINLPQYDLFDKGVYKFDLSETYCTPLYGTAMAIMDIQTARNDFSFDGQGSNEFTFSCDYDNITPNCSNSDIPYMDKGIYNSALGRTFQSLVGYEGFEFYWELLLYRKGNKEYNGMIIPLDSTYLCTDNRVALEPLSYYGSVEFSGLGVQNTNTPPYNYFNPALVPEELYNTPITFSYYLVDYCYPTECPSMPFYQTVTVNCPTDGDCNLTNFTADASDCDGYGEIYVDIDFDFENVGAENFSVVVNDEIFKTYSYQSLYELGSITVGPITADGTTDWEIYVVDNENQASCSTNTITIPAQDCTDSICIFSNFTVTPTCSLTGSYQVELSFDYQGAVSNSFQVTNSRYTYSTKKFSYSELNQNGSVMLNSNFIGDGEPVTFVISDSLATDCRDSVTIALDCLYDLCGIQNLDIGELNDSTICDGGTQFINFDHDPNSTYDLIILNPADTFYRQYGVQPPFQIDFDSIPTGTTNWETEILIVDSQNPCCKSKVRYVQSHYSNGNCYAYENIDPFYDFNSSSFSVDYEIEKINNNEEFLVHITNGTGSSTNYWDNFLISMLYEYTILVNGVAVGEYSIPEDIEVTIGPFPADASTDYVIEITSLCTDEKETSETIYLGYVGPNDCVLVNPYVTAEPCLYNDYFYFNVGFDYDGEVGDTYSIYVNGTFYDTYSYPSFSFINNYATIGPFPGDEAEYRFDVYDATSECSFTITATAPICPTPENAKLSMKVFLQGAYDPVTQIMSTTLSDKNLLPLSQPYSMSPWNYYGTEIIDDVLQEMVDWVLIEIRSPVDNTQVVFTKAALLLKDGSVVETDGSSDIEIDVPAGEYYVSVSHRNHLAIMTAELVNFDNNQVNLDFTNSAITPVFDQNTQIEYNDVYALWAGDVNCDGQIIFQGANNDANSIFFNVLSDPLNTSYQSSFVSSGYLKPDLNFDGQAIFQGSNNDPNIIFFNVILHPGNTTLSPSYIILDGIED